MIADRYEIRSVLGRGGMGEVYLAHDHRLATEVALKRVPLELAIEPRIREALVREARILARLSDNHIVRLFDLADTPDGLFLVLEYVCGPSLDRVLTKRGALTPAEVLHVIDHVAEGLKRAHSMGVIHRDLKPANLLVQLHGDEQRHYLRDGTLPPNLLNADIKVTDFGLARIVQNSSAELSQSISGTPAYMAPEQFRGEMPSVETDIYALGFVAYTCLNGRVPIGNADPAYFHMQVTPPPIAAAPPHMNAAIQKAVRKQREDRFHQVADFALALRQPVTPPPPPAKQETESPSWLRWRYRRPNPRMTVPAGVAVVIFAGLYATSFLHGPRKIGTPDMPQVIDERPGVTADLGPLAPLNPAQRIDALPPVIESARLRDTPAPRPRGISTPEILTRLRVTGARILAFGPDGTLYLTSNGSDIGAVREGRLLWQYRLAGDSAKLSIAPDGLVWIRSYEGGDKLFCFNSAGQGGEITNPALVERRTLELVRADSLVPAARCVDAGDGGAQPAVEMPLDPTRLRWRTSVDYGCERSPVMAPDGRVAAQTRSHTEYLLANDGRLLWAYAAPCTFSDQLLLGDGTTVGLCSDGRQLIGMRDGRQAFSITSDAGLSLPFAQDAGNNFYRLADSAIAGEARLIRTTSLGRDLWNVELPLQPGQSASMGPDGNLYILSPSRDGAVAVIVGEGKP